MKQLEELMSTRLKRLGLCALALFVGSQMLIGCADSVAPDERSEPDLSKVELDDNGKPTLDPTGWEPAKGPKADRIQGRRGLPTSVDNSATAVWDVQNSWDEKDPAAGMAWEADSGLTWDEKFHKWVASLKKVESHSYYKTFQLKTPFGKTIEAPVLECAEVAMFLRVTFANWYSLPFFMESRTQDGGRVFFGHFGIRTANGRWKDTPLFDEWYADYSYLEEEVENGERSWPKDETLRGRGIIGADDDQQPMIGPDARAGAYFDEIYLNKRAGYFMRYLLIYFGSMNLADSANTYNITASSIAPGSFNLKRYDYNSTGHTLIVMDRTKVGTQQIDGREYPSLEVELASGSMPRRQPAWNSPSSAKGYLTSEKAGGEGYAKYGGGLKRFRTAENVNGYWTNTVSDPYRDEYVDSGNHDRIGQRTELFEDILTELSPREELEALADVVESKRQAIQIMPATCANRIKREDTFDKMYEVAEEIGMTKAEVDAEYRKFQDYVFAELKYEKSKTCCWLSATPEMYDIIMKYNREHRYDDGTQQCREPVVFKARDDGSDGYEKFREYAEEIGRGDQWVDWSAGESCSQRDVDADTEANHDWTSMCNISDELTGFPGSSSDNGGGDSEDVDDGSSEDGNSDDGSEDNGSENDGSNNEDSSDNGSSNDDDSAGDGDNGSDDGSSDDGSDEDSTEEDDSDGQSWFGRVLDRLFG
jgi:hypothetical protein